MYKYAESGLGSLCLSSYWLREGNDWDRILWTAVLVYKKNGFVDKIFLNQKYGLVKVASLAFVSLETRPYTVDREDLWQTLEKYGIEWKVLTDLKVYDEQSVSFADWSEARVWDVFIVIFLHWVVTNVSQKDDWNRRKDKSSR